MGLLNLMVFEGYQNRKLQIRSADFQVIFPNHTIEELKGRFRFDEKGLPIVAPGRTSPAHARQQAFDRQPEVLFAADDFLPAQVFGRDGRDHR